MGIKFNLIFVFIVISVTALLIHNKPKDCFTVHNKASNEEARQVNTNFSINQSHELPELLAFSQSPYKSAIFTDGPCKWFITKTEEHIYLDCVDK